MSIVNFWTYRDRAVVAVDTRSLGSDGAYAESSKLLVMPHLPFVLAGRGSINVTGIVFQQLQTLPRSFEGYVELLPGLVPEAIDYVNRWAGNAGVNHQINMQEVSIVGWSEKRSMMIGHTYRFDPSGNGGGELFREASASISPGLEEDEMPGGFYETLGTAAGMMAAARKQLAWCARRGLDEGTGGRLLVAELTPIEVRVRSFGAIQAV